MGSIVLRSYGLTIPTDSYDWYVRVAPDRGLYFCKLLDVEIIPRAGGWALIRCANRAQRRVLQTVYTAELEKAARSAAAGLDEP